MRIKNAGAEKLHNVMYNVLLNNLLTVMYVLHNDYGFGAKRQEEFISHLMETVVEFDNKARADLLPTLTGDYNEYHAKLREILKVSTKQYIPKEMYEQVFCQALPTHASNSAREKNNERNRAISIKDAAKLQQTMNIVHEYMREKNEKKSI